MSAFNKRVPSSASSITSYASLSSMNSAATTTSSSSSSSSPKSSIEQYWLPPISTLLSGINAATNNENKALNSITKNKKGKLHQSTNKDTPPVYMPMIPYYFHHEQFGIEACMLQLEGQKKFNNYYYI